MLRGDATLGSTWDHLKSGLRRLDSETFGQFDPVWLWVHPALIGTELSALGIL